MSKTSASSRAVTPTTTKRRSTRAATVRRAAATISGEAFDAKFDAGEDVVPYLDLARATRPGREIQRVNVDFPVDLLEAIDAEARRIGVTRQAFIKLRLADTLTGR